jgi:hypothetical protein
MKPFLKENINIILRSTVAPHTCTYLKNLLEKEKS